MSYLNIFSLPKTYQEIFDAYVLNTPYPVSCTIRIKVLLSISNTSLTSGVANAGTSFSLIVAIYNCFTRYNI